MNPGDVIELSPGADVREHADLKAPTVGKLTQPWRVQVVGVDGDFLGVRTPSGDVRFVGKAAVTQPTRPRTPDEQAIDEALRARGHAIPGEAPIDYTGISALDADTIRNFERAGRFDVARSLAEQARRGAK